MKDPKILAGAAVLLGVVFWFVLKPQFLDKTPAPPPTAEQLAAAPKPTVKLEERVLNLKAPATAPNYLKTLIALEFADPKHTYLGAKGDAVLAKDTVYAAELKPEMPKIWDAIIQVIGGKSASEVSTPDGRDKLKTELIDAVNKQLDADHKVQGIYFETFVTQ